jgi:hypothetical protein
MIKARRMKWAGHVARMGEVRGAYNILVGRPEGRREDLGVDGRITLRWILGNRVWGCGLDSFGSGEGQVASSCEHGNEPSGSIKCGEFLD